MISCSHASPEGGEHGYGGLPKDDGEAARLYKLAAHQGNATAQANLGLFHEQGRGGLPKDDAEAARLYKLAADQGNAWAQGQLLTATEDVVYIRLMQVCLLPKDFSLR